MCPTYERKRMWPVYSCSPLNTAIPCKPITSKCSSIFNEHWSPYTDMRTERNNYTMENNGIESTISIYATLCTDRYVLWTPAFRERERKMINWFAHAKQCTSAGHSVYVYVFDWFIEMDGVRSIRFLHFTWVDLTGVEFKLFLSFFSLKYEPRRRW